MIMIMAPLDLIMSLAYSLESTHRCGNYHCKH